MAEQLVEVKTLMTAEDCIPQNINPEGHRYRSYHVPGTAMYEVKAEMLKDGKWAKDDRCTIPTILGGLWTSPLRANKAISAELHEAWRQSDKAAEKRARGRPKKEEKVEVKEEKVDATDTSG